MIIKKMSIISFDMSLNHIYFLLAFVFYFIRQYLFSVISSLIGKENYKFGDSKKATKKLFNIYTLIISDLFSVIFVLIIKLRTKDINLDLKEKIKKKEKSSLDLEFIYNDELPINQKKLLLRPLILSVCDFLSQICLFMIYFFVNNDNEFDSMNKVDISCIINILSKFLLSRLILKTYFYKHHYLSLGINILFLIILCILEIIEMEHTLVNVLYSITRIFTTICYSLGDIIGKRALIEEFLSPYSLLLYKGLYEIFILLIFSIPFIFIERDDEIVFSKMILFMNSGKKIMFNIFYMISNFIYNIFIWIIIDRFSPNDRAMASVIEAITDRIFILIFQTNKFEENLSFSILSLIIYFILIIGICIHNEIIIINVFGLNEYTKKKLRNKGDEDYEQTRARIYTNESSNLFIDEYSSRGSSLHNKQSSIEYEMIDKGKKLSLYDKQKSHSKTFSKFYFK